MRIIFMGSPEFAVPTLNALVAAGHEVVAAYTQPPRPAGRGKGEKATAIEVRARELGIEVRSPRTLRDEGEQQRFAALGADIAVVAAYGLILPQPILDAPRLGCLNVHASLLPRWRGAAPVQRAIMAGDAVTGVTIMQMEAGLDTGPMLVRREMSIGDRNTAQLTESLAELGAEIMIEVLADLPSFDSIPQPDDGTTHAPKIRKEEARIDFTLTADEVERRIRAFNPTPGAFFEVRGERIKILDAKVVPLGGYPGEVVDDLLTIGCLDDGIWPAIVQRAGKSPIKTEEFLRGFSVPKYSFVDGYPMKGYID